MLRYDSSKSKLGTAYKPNKKERERTIQVTDDFFIGDHNMRKQYVELNDKRIIQALDDNKKTWNSYIPPRPEDPRESWKANTVRPVTRNKLISIAAHVLAVILVPTVFAQNKHSEEDRIAKIVMNDLVKWVIENTKYSRKFVYTVIESLFSPVTYMHLDFVEVKRDIRKKMKDGKIETRQVIDKLMSGFQHNVISADEIYFSSPYIHEIEKQDFLIWRRHPVSYRAAKQKYGERSNFKYVKPGYNTTFYEKETTFYLQKDDFLEEEQVEVVEYYNRGEDLHLIFINGILMDHPDNPIEREDKEYPFVKTGYELIDGGKFFLYKSAAEKLFSDQDMIDTLYNMVLDGSFLSMMPPLATYGMDDIDSNIFVPGSSWSFDADTKIEAIGPRVDMRAGLLAIGEVEKSMNESTIDQQLGGSADSNVETAREADIIQSNARTIFGLFGRQISFLVEDYGTLLVNSIQQHMTAGQIDEITGDGIKFKYKSFMLPNQIDGGKSFSKEIKFVNEEFTEDNKLKNSFDILKQEGGLEGKKRIIKVNPIKFKDLKYSCVVDADQLIPKSKQVEQALKLAAYDRMIQNPTFDIEQVSREMAEIYYPGESDKFIKKQQKTEDVLQGQGVKQKGVNTNIVSQITGNNSLQDVV
jgi:hypothetical protein